MESPRHPAFSTVLRGLAGLYGRLARLRERHYDRPGNEIRAPIPVVSVGNLTLGGTGKTPVVAWLARQLQMKGRRPAVVSRGYGGRAGKGPRIVSVGRGPRIDPADCGDEPYLLARELTGAVVVVGSDRHRGALAAHELGAEVILLDDGFQHRRLARDLDIVLLDSENPFGNRSLLPAGPLREPPSALARADMVLLTRSRPGDRHESLEAEVREHNPDAPILRAGHTRSGFFDATGARVANPTRAVAFCGIGSPSPFRRDLEAEGVEIVAFSSFRDHHRYTARELDELRRQATAENATLVTTEKDQVRIGATAASASEPPVAALRIAAEVYSPEPLLVALSRCFDPDRELPSSAKRVSG